MATYKRNPRQIETLGPNDIGRIIAPILAREGVLTINAPDGRTIATLRDPASRKPAKAAARRPAKKAAAAPALSKGFIEGGLPTKKDLRVIQKLAGRRRGGKVISSLF